MKMNVPIRDRWLEALRSGKYEQTTEHLADAHGHCCLGVLCELAVEDGIVEKRAIPLPHATTLFEFRGPKPDDADEEEATVWFSTDILPRAVVEWAGFDDASFVGYSNCGDPGFEYDGEKKTLSTLNDDDGYSFIDIAAVIEKETTKEVQ